MWGFGQAFIHQALSEAVDQRISTFSRFQQDGAAVGARVRLIEGGDERPVEEVGKQDSPWYRAAALAKASAVEQAGVATALYHAEAFVSLSKSAPS